MEDIIEFANENLEGELDHDLLSFSGSNNRTLMGNSSRDWETSGISHLLNSSTAQNASLDNSGIISAANDFPSSSSSFSNTGESSPANRASSSSVRASRRKRNLIDPLNKKPRIDYKTPLHAERLNTAIDAVIAALRGDPGAFHRNITLIAKSHDIPYNTLRDNVLRARGIEPRAHRNSERKRQAEAVAAAKERGVEYKVPKSTLQLQTVRVSILIGDALADSPSRVEGSSGNGVETPSINGHHPQDIAPSYPLPVPLSSEIHKVPLSDDLGIKIKREINDEIMMTTEIQAAIAPPDDPEGPNFNKFLPLEIATYDSDSDEDERNK